MQDIDIALLRAFVALAETGNMTTAAKAVSRSQGAVSQQIVRLETALGLVLVDRQKNHVNGLSKDGEKLLGKAYRMIALNDAIIAEMRDTDFNGEVKLGVPHDVIGVLMPPILRVFCQKYPNVLITLFSDATKTLRRLLQEGVIDLTITTELEPAESGNHLLTDQLVWVGARGGNAGQRRPLSIALGNDICGFRSAAVKALNGARLKWRPVCQVGGLEPVFATLEADMAIAPFLSRTVPDRLMILKIPELPPLPEFSLNLRLPSKARSAVTIELARYIRHALGGRSVLKRGQT